MDKDYTIFDLLDLWEQDLQKQEPCDYQPSCQQAPSQKIILNILSYASSSSVYSPTLKKNIQLQWN
jgi:hypothetical protein